MLKYLMNLTTIRMTRHRFSDRIKQEMLRYKFIFKENEWNKLN
jgi:hypothetical protein